MPDSVKTMINENQTEKLNDYLLTNFSYSENELNTSQSRRQLFPSIEDDGTDDFSYITPLNSQDLSPCSSQTPTDFELHLNNSDENYLIFNQNSIQDYIIIENIYDTTKAIESDSCKNDDEHIRTPQSEKHVNEITMSPLFLSPAQIVPQSVAISPKKIKQKLLDSSENQDSSGLNTIANKLIRNYSVDNSPVDLVESGKRKFSFSSLLSNKQLKVEQISKVRTELFPKDKISVNHHSVNASQTLKPKKVNSSHVYLCSRKRKNHNFGQINAGVRHKIRKPKVKKISKEHLIKSALDIINNSPLNEYLKSIENITSEFSKKQIQPLLCEEVVKKQIQPLINDLNQDTMDKENITPKAKRPALSPLPEVPKKFFKSHRHSAVVVDDNLNFKITRDNINSPNTKSQDVFDLSLDTSDLIVPDKEDIISSDAIEKIVESLEEAEGEQLVLTAHTSVTLSENSILLHVPSETHSSHQSPQPTIDKSILLSPTSQMCNMTSGLALNSPTRNRKIAMRASEESHCNDEQLFPIFDRKQNPSLNNFKTSKVAAAKKPKPLPKNQLLLDFGQKNFGATQCSACKFVYHMGDPNDELIHLNYHNAGTILRFGGWKDERVVSRSDKARIIKVLPNDPKPWLKKVKDLLEVVNRDLGYFDMPICMINTQIFLYIHKQVIVGCLVAEPKTVAYKLLSGDIGIDLCSEVCFPIKCGVNRIWVSQSHRKEGIGTALLNSVRANFIYGYILKKEDMAFSSPTDAGKAFATKYFSTSNFLVYT